MIRDDVKWIKESKKFFGYKNLSTKDKVIFDEVLHLTQGIVKKCLDPIKKRCVGKYRIGKDVSDKTRYFTSDDLLDIIEKKVKKENLELKQFKQLYGVLVGNTNDDMDISTFDGGTTEKINLSGFHLVFISVALEWRLIDEGFIQLEKKPPKIV